MKQIFKLLLAAILSTGSGYAFAKGHSMSYTDSLETVNRQLPGFNALHISGPFDVYVEQGGAESVTFQAPKEISDRIVAQVQGSTLRISNKHDNWGWGPKSWWSDKGWWHRHQGKIVVRITLKDLNNIKLSGSGAVFFDKGITTNSLNLIVRGSGNVQGKVTAKALVSHISGSGNIKLSGTAGRSAVSVTGSGNFTAPELVTSNSAVHLSGSGGAKINATENVDAAISGSGGISYTGTAKIGNTKKSGSGSIIRF